MCQKEMATMWTGGKMWAMREETKHPRARREGAHLIGQIGSFLEEFGRTNATSRRQRWKPIRVQWIRRFLADDSDSDARAPRQSCAPVGVGSCRLATPRKQGEVKRTPYKVREHHSPYLPWRDGRRELTTVGMAALEDQRTSRSLGVKKTLGTVTIVSPR